MALYHAVNDNSTSSPCAIISDEFIESFPFDIDYLQLALSASSRNSAWGILQLSSTYDESAMTRHWIRYVRSSHTNIWTDYHTLKFPDLWPWKTYMISKQVLRPIINSMITRVQGKHFDTYNIKIIAAMKGEFICLDILCVDDILPIYILRLSWKPETKDSSMKRMSVVCNWSVVMLITDQN